jgi:hypothetical protein
VPLPRARPSAPPTAALGTDPAPVWRLDRFGIDELEGTSRVVRNLGRGATTMAESAQRITDVLHNGLIDEAGAPACPLVRFYATHRLADMDELRRSFALRLEPDLSPDTRCFTLLGSSGTEPGWRDAASSTGHLAIPLGSARVLTSLPMVSALFDQMGFTAAEVVAPDIERALELHHRDYEVFHVPDAVGSRWVPAQQEFVVTHGVTSVLGLGGALPSGDLFAMILFSRVPIPQATARMLQPLAAALKAAVVGFSYRVLTP